MAYFPIFDFDGMNSLSQYQDVFGQLAFLKTYTQLCIGFRIADASVAEYALTSVIQKAATKLTDVFPWLPGQVIIEVGASGPGDSMPFKIVRSLREARSQSASSGHKTTEYGL